MRTAKVVNLKKKSSLKGKSTSNNREIKKVIRTIEKIKGNSKREIKNKSLMKARFLFPYTQNAQNKKKALTIVRKEITKLRHYLLDYLHERKDRIAIIECRDTYIIIGRKVKLVTTEIANAEGFQPVEKITESIRVVMSILAIHNDLSHIGNDPKDFMCRALLKIGCPVMVFNREEDVRRNLND